MMHSYISLGYLFGHTTKVLILVLMDDALVQNVVDNIRKDNTVLILVLMDDALVRPLVALPSR